MIRDFAKGFRALLHNKALTLELAKKDYRERYHGQVLGLLWSILHPMVLICVYTVIFSYVVVTRSPAGVSPDFYVIYILSGLIPWLCFAEVLSRSTTIIRSQSSLIKQVIFPLEVIPVIPVLVAMITQLIFTFLLLILICFKTQLSWSLLLLPLALFIQFLGMVGLAYVLSSVSAYLRDIKEVVQVMTLVTMYTLPIFYLPDTVPARLQPLVRYNPLSVGIYVYQDIFYFQGMYHPYAWAIFAFVCLFLFSFGFRFFSKVKTQFGTLL